MTPASFVKAVRPQGFGESGAAMDTGGPFRI